MFEDQRVQKATEVTENEKEVIRVIQKLVGQRSMPS